MKKEEWINGILETASEIKEVEANPFLYTKIMARLSRPEKVTISLFKFSFGWAVVIFVVIALNVSILFIYKSKIHKQKEVLAIEVLSQELNTNTSYNF